MIQFTLSVKYQSKKPVKLYYMNEDARLYKIPNIKINISGTVWLVSNIVVLNTLTVFTIVKGQYAFVLINMTQQFVNCIKIFDTWQLIPKDITKWKLRNKDPPISMLCPFLYIYIYIYKWLPISRSSFNVLNSILIYFILMWHIIYKPIINDKVVTLRFLVSLLLKDSLRNNQIRETTSIAINKSHQFLFSIIFLFSTFSIFGKKRLLASKQFFKLMIACANKS